MKLVGTGYIFGMNVVFAFCPKCCELRSEKLNAPMTISCSCGPTEFSKPPLYYLKKTGLPMIIYKMTNHNTDKSFIGIVITSETKKIKDKIFQEIAYIRDFRRFKIDSQLKKDLSEDIENLDIEILSTPKSLSAAMLDEKLYINMHKTMAPEGYNKVYMVETLIKKARS